MSDDDKYRYFDLPHGGKFKLLAQWWTDAGMEGFRCEAEAYLSAAPAVQLIALADIAPPLLGDGRAHLTDSFFDRDRMVDILRGIARKQIMPPVEVMELPQGKYRYDLCAGWHRYHASVAAGFRCIPTVKGWKPDKPALNA